MSITKEAVQHVLLASQQEDIYSLTGYWTTPNSDSLFYKSDTVQFYNHQHYKTSSHGCSYLNWRFTSSHQVEQNESFICREPPEESMHLNRENVYYTKLEEKKQKVYLLTLFRGKVRDRFLVTELKKVEFTPSGDQCIRVSLVRVKQ